LQGEIRDLHRLPWFFTPIRILSNPDLTNRDLIKKNSSHCADTICIIEKKVKKQKKRIVAGQLEKGCPYFVSGSVYEKE